MGIRVYDLRSVGHGPFISLQLSATSGAHKVEFVAGVIDLQIAKLVVRECTILNRGLGDLGWDFYWHRRHYFAKKGNV